MLVPAFQLRRGMVLKSHPQLVIEHAFLSEDWSTVTVKLGLSRAARAALPDNLGTAATLLIPWRERVEVE